MATHSCPKCGFEEPRDVWHERHPVAAVLLALPVLYTIVGVILAYPWFCIPLLIVTAAVWVDRRNRRRAAIAARADWEHRERMARAIFSPHPLLPAPLNPPPKPRTAPVSVRHVLTDWPTTPMLTRPIRTRR
ncbi:hypothetical protein [Mycobacterium sp. HUMS_1102779]|uniref:hypothetical protein n=1 Tax=Mycobacterium sp. HUMS_1102779 TaxID=3383487 RepID=UPI00389ABC91